MIVRYGAVLYWPRFGEASQKPSWVFFLDDETCDDKIMDKLKLRLKTTK